MIRVHKPRQAPKVLQDRGRAARTAVCTTCRGARARIQRGELQIDFDKGIYGHASVKKVLVAAHHGKCCYCESQLKHVDHGDVEHYRPKAAVQQGRAAPLARPGYYWLAYEWENLLFSCAICNGTHKKNLFPIRDPRKRARSERARLVREEPLLVHPAKEDPEQLIGFREEYAYAIDGDPRAEATINEVLRLNDRPDLVERRRELLTFVRAMQFIATNATGAPEEQARARAWLARSTGDGAEYASMTRAALRAEARP